MEETRGRPTIYTEELGKKICERISKGESIRHIILDDNIPASSTIFRWLLDEDKKLFQEQYARSRAIQAELMFEELMAIADESDTVIQGDDKSDAARVNAKRLRVDTRKWYLSKVLPKKFGEKLDVTSDGKAIKGNSIIFSNFKEEDERKE